MLDDLIVFMLLVAVAVSGLIGHAMGVSSAQNRIIEECASKSLANTGNVKIVCSVVNTTMEPKP